MRCSGRSAFIVFLQFFTRYVLNDSLAWTEEIARYGLMCVTFIGGAMVTRRNTPHRRDAAAQPAAGRGRRASCSALVDLITLGFLGLLAYFSVLIVERMQVQRMTVFDLPMSYVYGAVALGCFLMLARQIAARVAQRPRRLERGRTTALTAGLIAD